MRLRSSQSAAAFCDGPYSQTEKRQLWQTSTRFNYNASVRPAAEHWGNFTFVKLQVSTGEMPSTRLACFGCLETSSLPKHFCVFKSTHQPISPATMNTCSITTNLTVYRGYKMSQNITNFNWSAALLYGSNTRFQLSRKYIIQVLKYITLLWNAVLIKGEEEEKHWAALF